MGNHYHLLVRTPDANLARGMRQLNGVYAQAVNRRYARDGHLFQGRYQAVLVQAKEHLLGAVRYILRNPLRAGMCDRVGEWRWSSHRATIGELPSGFLATALLLSYLDERRARARARYLQLVESEEDEEDLPPPSRAIFQGDDAFVTEHLARLELSPEHPRSHVSLPRPSLAELLTSTSDARAIAQAHREHGYSMRQIATELECGVTTIHRRIRAYEDAAS